MTKRTLLRRSAVLLLGAMYATPSLPQVPPHYPGTICFTPYSWCPLPGAVPVGTRCYCNGPYGAVYGQAG